jgi:hypothetical protein
MVAEFAQRLMAADVDSLVGAGWREHSTERVNYRNGYRQRQWDIRVGTIDLEIPKLRHDSHIPRRRTRRVGIQRVPQRALAPNLVERPHERLNKEIRRRNPRRWDLAGPAAGNPRHPSGAHRTTRRVELTRDLGHGFLTSHAAFEAA